MELAVVPLILPQALSMAPILDVMRIFDHESWDYMPVCSFFLTERRSMTGPATVMRCYSAITELHFSICIRKYLLSLHSDDFDASESRLLLCLDARMKRETINNCESTICSRQAKYPQYRTPRLYANTQKPHNVTINHFCSALTHSSSCFRLNFSPLLLGWLP